MGRWRSRWPTAWRGCARCWPTCAASPTICVRRCSTTWAWRALQQLADDWSRRSGIAVRADCGETGNVPPDVATALYRVAQEALGNIERHAAAGSVELQLTRRAGDLELLLADDGHGFDVGHVLQAPREGLGLTHMRERVETLGGRFEIASSAQGTRLRVRFGQRALRT